jgi:hypothetical protein
MKKTIKNHRCYGYSNDKQIIKQKYQQFKITCSLNALRVYILSLQ